MSIAGEPAHASGRGVVGRAFDAMAALVGSERRGMGVRELAGALGLPPSSAHRLLALLAAEGMVLRNPDATYSVGLAFMRLAAKATGRFSIRDAAVPVLKQLASEIDETALLALYDPARRQLMFAQAVESSHPLRYFIPLNEWTSAHAGASGMAVCAWLPPAECEAVLALAVPPLSPEQLELRLRDLQRVREVGYALSHGQRIEGAVGIAAPIFDAEGGVLGTAAVSIPEQRFDTAREAELGRHVRAAAAELTRRVGGRLSV